MQYRESRPGTFSVGFSRPGTRVTGSLRTAARWPLGYKIQMRYQTKLLITLGLLLTLCLSAAALAYWGVSQSHSYLNRSRIAHQELERQLQLSRHSQELFKAWTDTLLTGMS